MIKLLNITGYLEALSAFALFFIAMPIKYLGNDDTFVTHTGRIHGALFVFYMVLIYILKEKYKWSWKIVLIFLVAATIPGGTIWADKRLIKGEKYNK